MYIIVIVLMQAGMHKIASNQILYPNMEMCEVGRQEVVERLLKTQPTPDSQVLSKCTEISVTEHKAVLKERI
jgi:hypothetical protein